MPRELLDRPCRRTTHRQVRTERVTKDVNPRFTFARLAVRRTNTWMTFCVSGFPVPSQSTRGPRRCRASRKASVNRLVIGTYRMRPPFGIVT